MEFRTLLAHARPYRSQLALVVLLSLLSSFTGLALPWLGAQLLTGVLFSEPAQIATIAQLLFVTLIVLTGIVVASGALSASVSNRIQADFRRNIYAHMQRLPLGFFDQSRQGDLLALMTWEVARLSAFIAGTLTSVPAALLTCTGAVMVLFFIEPRIAILVPLLVPAYFISLKLIGRHLRSIARRVQEAEASIFASAEEDLEMLPAIKAFARENSRLAAYTMHLDESKALSIREARIYATLGPVMSLITALAAVALVILAGQSVIEERMTSPELFGFLLYAALLTRPVGDLSNLYGQFQTARGTLGRLQSVMEEPEEPGYTATYKRDQWRGEIEFRDVSFSYPGRRSTVRDVSFKISAGEIVALTGENGAGKSTLVSLLLGFYRQNVGSILVDDVDISTFEIRNLREAIGYVPQRPLLFNGTVRSNITFGREGATDSDLERAVDLAQARKFIEGLPYGLETEIGDHGVRLSGGQRQRIALARAILKDPPILVLDEATSMYDLEGEAAFVEACQSALSGRTVILITHRPASLALADRSIHIDGGRIVEVRGS